MDKEQEEKNNAIVQEIYERLADIQLQQRAILNNIPDIVWLKDKESRFLAVNEAFGAACGFSPEEVAGKTDLDIWPKELAESYRADDREVMTLSCPCQSFSSAGKQKGFRDERHLWPVAFELIRAIKPVAIGGARYR